MGIFHLFSVLYVSGGVKNSMLIRITRDHLSTFDGLLGLTKINTKFPFLKKLVEVNIGHWLLLFVGTDWQSRRCAWFFNCEIQSVSWLNDSLTFITRTMSRMQKRYLQKICWGTSDITQEKEISKTFCLSDRGYRSRPPWILDVSFLSPWCNPWRYRPSPEGYMDGRWPHKFIYYWRRRVYLISWQFGDEGTRGEGLQTWDDLYVYL